MNNYELRNAIALDLQFMDLQNRIYIHLQFEEERDVSNVNLDLLSV